MAFTQNRRKDAALLEPDDTPPLYTTGGCSHNPARYRGRVISAGPGGSAGGGCRKCLCYRRADIHMCASGLKLLTLVLVPRGQGPALSDLVPGLSPNKATWSASIRRPLLALSESGCQLIAASCTPFTRLQACLACASPKRPTFKRGIRPFRTATRSGPLADMRSRHEPELKTVPSSSASPVSIVLPGMVTLSTVGNGTWLSRTPPASSSANVPCDCVAADGAAPSRHRPRASGCVAGSGAARKRPPPPSRRLPNARRRPPPFEAPRQKRFENGGSRARFACCGPLMLHSP